MMTVLQFADQNRPPGSRDPCSSREVSLRQYLSAIWQRSRLCFGNAAVCMYVFADITLKFPGARFHC